MENRRRVEARLELEPGGSGGADERWVVAGATLHERLSEPFVLQLDVAQAEPAADAGSLLGRSCVLTLTRRSSALRLCGVVTMVREGSDPNHQTRARLTVEPALSALRHRSDTRIFQGMSVPDILQQVLGEGLAPFGRKLELRLQGSYPTREYTVQYGETDFDFVHRLMEEEGIGYAFDHEDDHELLALFDRPAHFLPLDGPEGSTVRYVTRGDSELDASEGISRFEQITRLRPNRVVARHFDWTHPSVPMVESASMPDAAWPELETYVHDAPLTFHGYDHTYGAHNAADQVRLYAERARRDARSCDGTGSALGLRPGRRFELAQHPRGELDGAWAVVTAEHRYLEHVRSEDDGLGYLARFVVLPADVPWRPDRIRPRPRIVGVQTATVVGPPGEEIHCDPHGRVKVQFHWDRLGGSDDKSSCWIRVMQAMGGPGWGFSFIPRMGMEVVVTFVEGDPDRPLITGVVYNAENPPPYDYPADKTRTTIKSNSSPGGEGFNELRFEDRAGEEEIWLHGEKDWNTLIKNDLNRRVGHDETQEVGVDRTRKVGHDEELTVGHDRRRRVEHDETILIGADRRKHVGANETVVIDIDETKTIGANATETIGANLAQQVALNAMQTIGLSQTVNVGQSSTRNVVQNDTLRIGGDGKREVGKSLVEKIGANLTQKIKQNLVSIVSMNRNATVALTDSLIVGLIKTVTAGKKIEMTCGKTKVVMDQAGTITWEIAEGAKIELADKDVTITAGEGGTVTIIGGPNIHLNP